MVVMEELVSLLIPTYNSESFINETLDCALNQTYSNIEIIVYDNFSSDSTWDIIKSKSRLDDRIKIFRQAKNVGALNNWISCANKATGSYSKILWSDDLIELNFIEESLKLFNSNTAFVFSNIKILQEGKLKNYYSRKGDSILSKVFIYKSIFNRGLPVSPGCAIFRTKEVRKYLNQTILNKPKIDLKKLAIGNDLLLMLSIASCYKMVRYSNRTASIFRAHKKSISMRTDPVLLNYAYALTRYYFVKTEMPRFLKLYNIYMLLVFMKYGKKESIGINSFYDLI